MAPNEHMTQDILREIRASPNVLGAALIKGGEISFSTLPGAKIALLRLIAKRLEHIGRFGDYVVKKTPSSSLIAVKGPGPYVLAVEGRGPDGVLISVATRLALKLEESLGLGHDLPSDQKPGSSSPAPVSLSPNAVPVIKPVFSAEIAIDADVLRLLRHVDGLSDVRALARALGITQEEALSAIARLVRAGIVHVRTRAHEEEDRALLKLAKVAYELDERLSGPDEALRMLGSADDILRLIAANLHRGLTAVDYKRLAEEAGLDASLPSIIRALESLRSMGIARRKGEKRRSGEGVRRDIPPTAISVLLTTIH